MGLDGVFLKLKRQKETERKIKSLPRGDILPKYKSRTSFDCLVSLSISVFR
jgi:hypothetical protein